VKVSGDGVGFRDSAGVTVLGAADGAPVAQFPGQRDTIAASRKPLALYASKVTSNQGDVSRLRARSEEMLAGSVGEEGGGGVDKTHLGRN
jgi:hypothetical protein